MLDAAVLADETDLRGDRELIEKIGGLAGQGPVRGEAVVVAGGVERADPGGQGVGE